MVMKSKARAETSELFSPTTTSRLVGLVVLNVSQELLELEWTLDQSLDLEPRDLYREFLTWAVRSVSTGALKIGPLWQEIVHEYPDGDSAYDQNLCEQAMITMVRDLTNRLSGLLGRELVDTHEFSVISQSGSNLLIGCYTSSWVGRLVDNGGL